MFEKEKKKETSEYKTLEEQHRELNSNQIFWNAFEALEGKGFRCINFMSAFYGFFFFFSSFDNAIDSCHLQHHKKFIHFCFDQIV